LSEKVDKKRKGDLVFPKGGMQSKRDILKRELSNKNNN
jgi:hypothetical protein